MASTKKQKASAAASTDTPADRNWTDDEEIALRLWIALARCYLTLSREVAARVADYDLTLPQFGVLEALHHLGPLALGELAEKLLVTGGNVTFVMDRLERDGLVYRDRSADDRRVVLAKLTPEGRRMIQRVFRQNVAFIDGLMEELEPKEQEELRHLLKKLGKSVTPADKQA